MVHITMKMPLSLILIHGHIIVPIVQKQGAVLWIKEMPLLLVSLRAIHVSILIGEKPAQKMQLFLFPLWIYRTNVLMVK